MPDTVAPPIADSHRLLGVARELRRDELGMLERVHAVYGDVVGFPIGPPGLRMTNYGVFHPEGAQRVLTDRGFRRQTFVTAELRAAFGNGLLMSDGEFWRRQRRTIQPLFTRQQVRRYAGIMNEEAAALVDTWSAAEGPVDARSQMSHLTLRVVSRALFGGDVTAAAEVISWAFPLLSDHAFRRMNLPVKPPWHWPTPAGRRARRARDALRGVVDEIVARRRRERSTGDDLVSLLAAARDPETGDAMHAEHIRDEALVFLLAGHETTATTMTFALDLLARHPQAQERVHGEVDAVLGGRAAGADDLAALPYTSMVLKEAMRLYPPAWILPRQATEDSNVDGYDLPAGPLVFACPWITHRHPDFWDDPQQFDPERFTPEAEAERPRYAYMPFGGGPHTCIGGHFGMLEMVVLLATIAQAFTLKVEGPAPALVPAVTLRPRDPVRLAVQPR